jgi:ABC-type transporter Mla maintaining outer membrane lipid asymmetry ATPase subunit MlaF
MATHCFDQSRNEMRAVASGEKVDVRTSFLILRDAKVLFDGTAHELMQVRDPYIREYIS